MRSLFRPALRRTPPGVGDPGLPSKSVTLSGRAFTVFGPTEDDPYFQAVSDNLDPDYTRVAEMNVPADGVCVDIGANIGLKAMQLAHLAPRGRVVAVEAGPRIHKCLEAGIVANGLGNIAPEQAAITDHHGTVRFAESSAYGHIAPDGVEVPAMTLATVLDRHGLDRLDFLKLDVEGFEFPILRSSHPLFVRHGTVVCFELNLWCMLALTDDHPRLCLEWVIDSFAETYVLRRDKPPEAQLERVPAGGAGSLLAKNMMEDGHVTDIVVCTVPGKVRS